MPETSIIIRTFNEEKHLGNLLDAIKNQDYKNYEIIIVDSGSTDATLDIARGFTSNIIEIESRDFTFGYALNVGCKNARGEYLVVVSAHVLPSDNKWLSNLIAPFRSGKIAKVYGRQLGHPTSKFSENRDFKRIFGAKAIETNVPLDYVNHANAVLRRRLWESRPFDEYLFGLEDIEWAKYITGEGYSIYYEPKAAVHHIHEEEWHQIFNRYRREAIAAARIGLRQPPQGRTVFWRLLLNLTLDFFASFPNWSLSRLEEILRFRYYQWKGSRQGWLRDKNLDLNREKYNVFFPTRNKSVVIKGKDKAMLEEIPVREMKPGDILIKVNYVGVCRTDLEILEGTLGYYRDGIADYPIVPGHEFSGTIIGIGANNKFRERFKVGERIVGECILARGGKGEKKEVGVINYNGAYSDYIIMPGDAIHKIPDGMDPKVAAMAEPLAVVLRALRRIENRLTAKSSVAVMGAGPIGNLCVQILSFKKHRVSVFDRNIERLKLLDGVADETHTKINNLDRFDIIVEATGSKDVLEKVIKDSRNDSTILLLGFPYGSIGYNFEDLVGFEKTFAGSVGGDSQDFTSALKLLPELNMNSFVKKVLPLENFKEAWELHKSSKYLKILLQP